MYLKERSRGRNNKDLQLKGTWMAETIQVPLVHQRRFEHPTHGTILGLPGLFGNINLFADFR